jgi:hypothetical protein
MHRLLINKLQLKGFSVLSTVTRFPVSQLLKITLSAIKSSGVKKMSSAKHINNVTFA